MTTATTTTQLLHHGAAASSSSHTLVWIPNDDDDDDDDDDESSNSSSIIYSSHGIINICRRSTVLNKPVWSVVETLRTTSSTTTTTTDQHHEAKRVITALCAVRNTHGKVVGLASGFSDGTVNYWNHHHNNNEEEGRCWLEQVLQEPNAASRSITDIDGMMMLENDQIMVIVCTSVGVVMLRTTHQQQQQPQHTTITTTQLATFSANTVRLQQFAGYSILLVGTAAPRHNKIHVYWIDDSIGAAAAANKHVGHLMGHEDWLTDFSWDVSDGMTPLLASASQDARIRLWEFKTTLEETTNTASETMMQLQDNADEDDDINDEFDVDDEEDEGEARLEFFHSHGVVTRVTLEALLYGHEEPVTCVAWHPKPQLYSQDRVLLSSSMDRTLLIWTCLDGGVWTPLSRVGAAGGILGGSIGSTLLGFLGVAIDPLQGESLVGHAYGGALHVWTLEQQEGIADPDLSPEEVALCNKWKATPCVTGHFDGITDCCWEAATGEYLLTVSNDQTCRLWGPVSTSTGAEIWVELARPQVHGYDLTTLTSVSTLMHRHLFVSGADEKEIRVFDAPMNAIKMLQATKSTNKSPVEDVLERVERAYIPSLGLSNKASAADGADEDTEGIVEENDALHLPLERDLGAVSLWPEVGKLYGHNTELYCLTSTLTAKSGPQIDGPFANESLVASSAKARDIQDASIRIWDVESGKCVQVLSGGHKSTVATLCFSPEGSFLATSGKDRRLCIWTRTTESTEGPFVLATAVDSAHKRIVWSAHFCPHDSTLLATGSRDGIVKIWKIAKSETDAVTASVLHTFEATYRAGKKAESVTAVAFAPIPGAEEEALLAIGLDNGLIEIWAIGKDCRLVDAIEPTSCHFATVTKLCWKPVRDDGDDTLLLASVSNDHGVRLFRVNSA